MILKQIIKGFWRTWLIFDNARQFFAAHITQKLSLDKTIMIYIAQTSYKIWVYIKKK